MTQRPLFEGREVHTVQLKLTGPASPGRALAIGEEIIVVARATVTGVNHVDTAGQLVRTHSAKVSEGYELPTELDPESLLEQAAKVAGTDRQARRSTADE